MKILFLLLCSLSFLDSAFCQDLILKNNGDTIRGKVLIVGIEKIKYSAAAGNDSINKVDVHYIFYPNGLSDTFSNTPWTGMAFHDHNFTLAERGELDARRYYKGFRGAMYISMYPFYGILPAVICSLTPPKYERLGCPYPELMQKEAYRNTYTRKAYKIKKTRIWEGVAVGTGSTLVLAGLLLAFAH